MKAGDLVEYLDNGIAVILSPASVPAPVPEDDLAEFLADPDMWPTEKGWAIKIIKSGDVLHVQHETLVPVYC